MARVTVRTVHLSRDVAERALTLFGTVKNAHRQLGLEHLVDYLTVYNAFQHKPIRPEHKELIEDAWTRWCFLFLRPEVPVFDPLQVDDSNREDRPSWLVTGRRQRA